MAGLLIPSAECTKRRACEAKVPKVTTLAFLHHTEDGFIISEVTRLGRRKWFAHHFGLQLDGGKIAPTLRDAVTYLMESFREMFPEHRCGPRCRTAGRDPQYILSVLEVADQSLSG